MFIYGGDDAQGGFERTECLSELACDVEGNGGNPESGTYPVCLRYGGRQHKPNVTIVSTRTFRSP